MLKPKQYDLEDSNVENIGGEDHRNAVKGVAANAPEWKRWKKYLDGSILTTDEAVKDAAGLKHHVEIWRIEKFKVRFWPREQIGQFYSGDAYLILHTYEVKEEGKEKIEYDLHFWLGKDSTQDEQGTAAYKTVELDTLLEDVPVQMREVQEHESEAFMNIFSGIYKCGGLRYMEGGIDSGFRHVEPESYKPRLMQVKGTRKKVRVLQKPLEVGSLNSGDIFIVDNGLKLYSFKGSSAGMFERNKGRELADAIKTERKGKAEIIFLNEGDTTDPDYEEMMNLLGGDVNSTIKTAEEGGSDTDLDAQNSVPASLWRLSDASGEMTFSKEKEGSGISMSDFDSSDVFILDSNGTIFAWVGKNATVNEKNNAVPYATKYLHDEGRPQHMPIVRILEGAENKNFKLALG